MPTDQTRTRLLDAARSCLRELGFAKLSTRQVAERAGVPLSQIHYHFGGRQGLTLALLAHENELLVARQRRMYGEDVPLWKRYEQACDFLEDDLESGYVRVLQEMLAAGWSDPEVANAVLALLDTWMDLLADVAREAEERFGSLGPFSPDELGLVLGLAFLGGEELILLGDEPRAARIRGALRRVGDLIRMLEEAELDPPAKAP